MIALVDSESALGAAVKGYSTREDISDLVTRLWDCINRHRIVVYFDRVSTDANIGDGPSRNIWSDADAAEWARQKIHFS